MILGYLSQTDLACRAMGVSQMWRDRCRAPQLWRHLAFFIRIGRCPQPQRLRIGVLDDVVNRRSGKLATSLTIHGLWDFDIQPGQFAAMLKALSRLKTLDIAGRRRAVGGGCTAREPGHPRTVPWFELYWEAICRHAGDELAEVSVAGFDAGFARHSGPFVTPLKQWLVNTKLVQSLETLSISNMTAGDVELILSGTICRKRYKKLERLSITQFQHLDRHLSPYVTPIPVDGLIRSAPELKDLTWKGYLRTDNFEAPDDPWVQRFLDNPLDIGRLPWPCLRRLQFDDYRDSHLPWGPISNSMRSLEFQKWSSAWSGLYAYNHPLHPPGPPALEHFRCVQLGAQANNFGLDSLYRAAADENPLIFLGPSIASGSLRSLDIDFVDGMPRVLDDLFQQNKGTLHTLSFHDFSMSSTVTQNSGNWEACLACIQTFPNLTTVGLFSRAKAENAWMAVVRFLKMRPGIQTVYTNFLTQGAIRDEIRVLAAAKGVEIVEGTRIPEPKLQFPPPPPWVAVEEVGDDEEPELADEGALQTN